MSEINKKGNVQFSFSKPATYEIKVLGKVPEWYAERLSEMTISFKKSKEDVITTLISKMSNQDALSGVLNTLYDLHMSVISIKKINNQSKTQEK